MAGGGRLTTHVLDTASGRPAQGLAIELYRVDGDERRHLKAVTTNADGRIDQPLLAGDELRRGTYEVVFRAGAYRRAQGPDLPEPAFLDVIPLRFGIAEPGAHYHVPLL